jgi:hydrocephalus-inducing protein
LQLTLITSKLGEITLPLHINVVGSNNNQPHLLNICANSDGPKVSVTPEEIDYGQVEVLKDYYQKVTIVNNSKIRAEFHSFTRQKVSIFKPRVKHAFLEPGEKL